MKDLNTYYTLLEERKIPECGGTASIYEHKKTGARIFTIKNQDKNKVFYIGFRTTPKDDTGVPHILEHSVLCGSEGFPLKDPFVELAKGSLNTFLNAMTYPDKTVYPVASCNDRDFTNLMDVYMDAVLHPNIYHEKRIFEQEGWHYEVSPEGELSYNGVVYNEMKGAFSNPEAVLERYTMHALFPDTVYGVESGGDPDHIPELSYEDFLEFHRTYYHPSNSYIYLYGDMDMEEKLLWLEEHYLYAYDRREVPSEIGLQEAFAAPREERIRYALGDNEDLACRSYLSANFVTGGELDPKLYIAWQILEFLLLDVAGAPLKEALLKAGIGEDIFGGYNQGIRQPYFSIIAKNAEEKDQDRFRQVIRETVEKLVREGINRKLLLAALNYSEFKYREADYGRMPTGLVYGLCALDSWLYGGKPYIHLCYGETFDFLRQQVETGYFEKLLEESLLDNPFGAFVTVVPEKGLQQKREEELAKRLSAYGKTLSEAEITALRKEAEALRSYQEEPTSEEALRTLPMLQVKDIGREGERTCMKPSKKLLWSDFDTNGIAYIRVLFDTKDLSSEELQFAAFLRYLYGELDTAGRDYRSLAGEILMRTGGLDFEVSAYPDMKEPGAYQGYFLAELRVLSGKIAPALSLLAEILNDTLFEDGDRVGEKLLEAKSRMQMKLDNGSHSAAVVRAGSYFRADQRYEDLANGIAFYDFLAAAARFYQIPSKRKHFLDSLKKVAAKLFVKKNMTVALAGGKEEKKELLSALPEFRRSFPAAKPARPMNEAELSQKSRLSVCAQGRVNEGFRTTSGVNYVARCGSYVGKDLPYTGALRVLRVLLNYEYLWQNLRVKGGAYGCMAGFVRSGRGYLVSYRDPNLRETNRIYEELPAYLEQLTLSDRDMTKYIIGAIAELDQPAAAPIRASRYLSAWLSGITDEDFDRERKEVLGCNCETLRGLAKYVRALLSEDCICVIGNAGKIDENRDLFHSVRNLY